MTPLTDPERLRALAEDHGTPLFVYDAAAVRRRIQRVRSAFEGSVAVLYAVKANPFEPLLTSLRDDVDGLDVASLGEMDLARFARYLPERLRLAGPGKSPAELDYAVRRGVPISVESPEELQDIATFAKPQPRPAEVLLRLEIDPPVRGFAVRMAGPTHPFGLDAAELSRALEILSRTPALRLRGVHVYGGSQCRSGRAWLYYLNAALDRAHAVAKAGWPLDEVNVGGGLGVATPSGPELDVDAIGPRAAAMLAKFRQRVPTRFVVELGRYLVAGAGVYLTRVVRIKRRPGTRVAVLDGGVHHLWAATGQIGPPPAPRAVQPPAGIEPTELMGPLCTPLDHLGRIDAAVHAGDLIAFDQVGAYGRTLSPTGFLSREPPREIVLDERG